LPLSNAIAQSSAAPPTPGWVGTQAPGYYRFKLGEFRITALSDGTAPRDLPKIMSKPDEVRRAYSADHEQLPVPLSINCYLIDTGDHRILIDTGAGKLFGVTSGDLVANMLAAGYRPEDVDVILLTHVHGDHSGGLSIGGQRVFLGATVYVDKRDPAHWLNDAKEQKAPKDKRTTFRQSHQTVDPYVQAGRLKTFDGATKLFPGVTSVPEYGHTPGLSGYLIESKGERLLAWGDIVHAAEAQFADPSVTIEYDVSPDQAVASRRRILAEAASWGYLIASAHVSFPGLGHVKAQGSGYVWVPAPYEARP